MGSWKVRPKVYIPTVAVAPAASPAPVPATVPSSPGRGGKQHKYLQSLIKQIGEDRGFRATVEKSVLDGSGSIDVALEREGCAVACEISVTTPTEYEIGNLAKCLEAGFAQVVLVSTDKKALTRARDGALKALSAEQCAHLSFLSPEALPAFLDTLTPAERVEAVNGYRGGRGTQSYSSSAAKLTSACCP